MRSNESKKDLSGQDTGPSVLQKKEFDQKFVTALGTGQLDIQAYKLTTVPPMVYELRNLRRLLMQSNRLVSISPLIGGLTNLVGLYLNDNCLVDFPPEIGQLRGLMTLALHNNQLITLPQELGRCVKLQNLSLSNNKLTSIPLEIGNCSDLKSLEMRDNPSLAVPPPAIVDQGPGIVADYLMRFGQTGANKKLDLAKFKLKAFPIEVTWAADLLLFELDLSDNILTRLPREISRLSTLETLRLVRCRLAGRLSQGLGELTSLTDLRLDNNEIEALPVGLGRCSAMVRLSLEQNWPLRLPPRTVQNRGHPHPINFLALIADAEVSGHLTLQGLELVTADFLELAVSSRRIAPEDAEPPDPAAGGGPWTHLEALDLSQNRLSALSEAVGAMTGLEALLCHRNRITHLPDSTTRLARLRHVRLDDNQLAEFPAVLCFADSGARVEQSQTFGTDVSDLGIKAAVLVWVPGAAREGLETLDVSDNLLRTLHKAVVRLASLQVLRASNNKLARLPPDFCLLTSLVELDLSRNEFAGIPDDLWTLTRLRRLALCQNRVLELSPRVQELAGLTELDISENRIAELPLELGRLRQLIRPSFQGNPLDGIPINLKKSGDATILACWRAMIDSAVTRTFDASNTGMLALPLQLASMTWLVELDVSRNQLFEIGAQVFELESLRVLNAAHNRLSSLPAAVSRLTVLRCLDLRGNNITALPLELGQCVVLQELQVDAEKITMPSRFVMSLEVNAVLIYLRRLIEAELKLRLALTGMALPSIPTEVLSFTELQELSLDKNKISTIEQDIVYFDQLVSFCASVNQITNLSFLEGDTRSGPWSRPRLANLRIFNVRGNQIRAVPREVTRLKALEVFQLDNNLVEELPDLSGLRRLEVLTASNNLLSLLPASISTLQELGRLEVCRNRIWALPYGLGNLPNLGIFLYTGNPIRIPPPEVMKKGHEMILEYLRNYFLALSTDKLNCSGLGLYDLPAEICNFHNLAHLNLSDNNIRFLRDPMTCLTHLEVLNLADNKMKTFPTMICFILSLGSLDLSRNPLNSLPIEFGQLTILRRLGLDGISLVKPAPEIASLKAQDIVIYLRKFWRVINGQSRILDISGVGFSGYPREITAVGTKLEILKLDNNKLRDLTAEVSSLCNLQQFSASHNELYSLPIEITRWTSMQILKLAFNNLNSIPNVRSLRQLSNLDLSSNQLVSLPLNMRLWTSLRELNLSNNKISEIYPEIGDLERLTALDLSKNRLQALPKTIDRLSRLCTLDLSFNLLTWLPASVSRVTSLISLLLRENNIAALPPALFLCSRITNLDISTSKLVVPPPETHNGGVKSMFSFLQSLYLANADHHLRLYNWKIHSFPLDGNFLTSITHLDLRQNNLRVLPPLIAFYLNICSLELDSNLLETLPEQIGYLHSSLTNISISSNNLSRLPAGTWKLTRLTRMALSNNKLSHIPGNLSKLTKLRHADFDFNQIQIIPDAVGLLVHLQELWLEGNPIKSYDSEALSGCTSMRNLKVPMEGLEYLKKWMKDTTVFAHIAGHGVVFPPSELVLLGTDAVWKYLTLVAASRKTKNLSLSRTSFWNFDLKDHLHRFYSWPQDLSAYDHLEYLNLAGNLLLTIPPTVSNLTNLVELDLEDNRLKSLPEELCLCVKLDRVLVLRNPDLEHPSREVTRKGSTAIINYLKSLSSARTDGIFCLEGSAYRRVPIEIMSYITLTSLSLANNALEIIPTEIRNLTHLKRLSLGNNLLVMLPDEICLLDSLETLIIENNKLVALPDYMTKLTGLQQLMANGNYLCDAPPEISKHGPWLVLDFMDEVKTGRITGSLDLSGFEILEFYPGIAFVDRPLGWTPYHLERFVRCFADDLNQRRRRMIEAQRLEDERNEKVQKGLDPNLMTEFSESKSEWNPIEEFFDDATFQYSAGQVRRRRGRLRTLDEILSSFETWYAFAIGYNSYQDMESNKDSDEDVKNRPSKNKLYRELVARFGPPELELPCISCIELGIRCRKLDKDKNGKVLKRRHAGEYRISRLGWYNIRLRKKHGPRAAWSDDEEESKPVDDLASFLDDHDDSAVKEVEDADSDDTFEESDSEDGDEKAQASEDKGQDLRPSLTQMLSGGHVSHVHSLNLHNNLIMQLPPAIRALRALQNLRLSYNLISVIPPELGSLTNLENLNIAGNRVMSLPFEMSSLGKLSTLDLRKNEFKQLPDTLVWYTNLSKLSVQGNRLYTVSDVIGKCSLLTQLWLQDNKLTSIHPLVGNLERLRVLNLGNNMLTSIPPQIGNCYALNALGLYDNQLARLPPSLKRLKYVKRFMVGNNSLIEIPDTIMFMHSLDELHVNSNQISSFEVSLCRVESLQTIRFQNNHLKFLPREIRMLTNVTELRLDYNELEELPPEISAMTSLKMIQLAKNLLTTLQSEVGSLTNLKKLSADYNMITELADGVGKMESLCYLWLDHNRLESLPEGFGNLSSLVELHLDDNHLHKLCLSFSKLTNLTELFVHNNWFGLSRNSDIGYVLEEALGIPEQIFHLNKLRALTISGNKLSVIPDDLTKLTNLTEIWLQDNNFASLPIQICYLPRIRYMLLDSHLETATAINEHYSAAGNNARVPAAIADALENARRKYRSGQKAPGGKSKKK